MSADTVCRVCLVNNLKLYNVRKFLQNTYEILTREKYIQVGYPLCMCHLCLSVLRKCHRFMETARDTNRLLKQSYNEKNEMNMTEPLSTNSLTKGELLSTENEHISSEQDINTVNNTEQLVSDIKTEYTEFDSDVDKVMTDKEGSYKPTCNQDKQTDPFLNSNMDNEWSGLDIISQHNNDHSQVCQNMEITAVKPETEKKYEMKLLSANETPPELNAEINIQEIHENDSGGLVADDSCPKSEILKCKQTQNQKRLQICGVFGESCTSTCSLRPHIMNHPTTINPNTIRNILHQNTTTYSCNECSYKCIKQFLLIRHLRTHKYTSAQTSQSTQQTIVHTGENRFTCDICGCKFTQKAHLKSHTRIHTGEQPFLCDICGFKSAYKGNLRKHMITHTEDKRFACDICGYKFAQKAHLKNHMRTHTGEKRFACNICGYKCAEKAFLTRHMRTHTGEKRFSCNICGFKFAKKSALTRHMRIHTGEKRFTCHICGYKTAHRGNLTQHMIAHTGEKRFACDICGNKFSRKEFLTRHMITHTGERQFSCDVCGHTFARKDQLMTHMRIHTGEKPFSCNICSYKCSQKSSLTIHMRTHTGEKPYTCDICQNKFSSKGTLAMHIRTHMKTLPKCARRSTLSKHMRSHTGKKIFLCDLCGYKCALKSNLSIHMRTHTGVKPFSCGSCEYKVTKKSYLKRHMLTKHMNNKLM